MVSWSSAVERFWTPVRFTAPVSRLSTTAASANTVNVTGVDHPIRAGFGVGRWGAAVTGGTAVVAAIIGLLKRWKVLLSVLPARAPLCSPFAIQLPFK
ncbi:hypothetical protein GCM10009765_69000 [Fodinicola feengrottensis]|uniref:Uncharacterized protein n=1 Tax=Fodinicola feengrottensis TaxID=435914 RepID=A0ABN2IQV8_9ACTN